MVDKQSSKVIGFEASVGFRIREIDLKKIEKIVNKNQDLFYNESHFFRASALMLAREFDKNGVRKKK
jgi:hypothetical protein